MFIKITKLQKWPKRGFRFGNPPGWLPVFWQARIFRVRESNVQSRNAGVTVYSVFAPVAIFRRRAQKLFSSGAGAVLCAIFRSANIFLKLMKFYIERLEIRKIFLF